MKKQHVKLSEKDKDYLSKLLSKGDLKVKIQKRAIALEMLDKGATYQAVEKVIKTKSGTISSWAKKYKLEGLTFLEDKPRSGRPKKFDGKVRAEVTAVACSTPPMGYQRWSLRLLSDRIVELEIVDKISHTDVGRILKKTS